MRGWAAKFARAVSLFRAFHGRDPKGGEIAEISGDDTILRVGKVAQLRYVDSRGKLYEHDFAKSDRPLLFVSSDGSRAAIVKGRWRFTARGFVNR
jgi:hypothetical protein